MSELFVSVSAPPDALGRVAGIADGIEVKLDWEHADRLDSGATLTERCREQGVDPAAVASVHLPPGTTQRYGMAVAPGNTGTIADFTHGAFGPAVDPDWLTVHSARSFDYREHVERLRTVAEVTGHALAVENTPDASHFHAPEELAAIAVLADRVDGLGDVSLLVDTAHVPTDRREFRISEAVLSDVLDRMDDELAARIEAPIRRIVERGRGHLDRVPPVEDPWRPVLATLAIAGGEHVRALHLNDPDDDGLPDVDHGGTEGLRAVRSLCRRLDIAVVLEPGTAPVAEIADVVAWLRTNE